MYYVEWTDAVNKRTGNMVPIEQLPTLLTLPNPGWVTNYQFPEATAKQIKASGNSRGFSDFSVKSTQLIIDFDGGLQNIQPFCHSLVSRDVSHTIYDSGGKGAHIHIAIEPMEGINVPYSQKVFVEKLFGNVDGSIYGHHSLIALPGRMHPKTGKPKREVGKYLGEKSLKIPVVKPVEFNIQQDATMQWALNRILQFIEHPPGEGNRTQTLWSIAKTCAEAGLSYDTTLELLTPLANQVGKHGQEALRPIKEAFKRN
jgi:hypothetical protein